MNKTTFLRCKDPNVAGSLLPTEFFLAEREVNGVKKNLKFRVQYKPVFMPYSSNWTVRAFSRSVNKEIGLDKDDNLTEYIYLNKTNIHRFAFPSEVIARFNRDRQLTEFLNNNKTK